MFRHCQQTAQLLSQALHSNVGSSRQLVAAIGSYSASYGRVSTPTATPPTASSDASLRSAAARHFSSSSRKADVVIVGAGHNGLVAALLLAKQGLKVSTVSTLPPLCMFSFCSTATHLLRQHSNMYAINLINMQHARPGANWHRHTVQAAAAQCMRTPPRQQQLGLSPFHHNTTSASHGSLLQQLL